MNRAALLGPMTCPVCGSKSVEIYLDGDKQDLDSSEIGSSRVRVSPGRILRCCDCRFGFRQVRSSLEKLRDLYRQMDTGTYVAELEGRNRTARRHLEIVQRDAKVGRILDVGCASGLFLHQALDAGWDATGIEPSEILYAEALRALTPRGRVLCATLEDSHLEPGFDAITLWDVLEHIPDPSSFLKTCRRLLREGGCLFLNVPDLDSIEARVLGRRWPLLLPEHLNYFNKSSLCHCAQRAGLRPVRFGRRRAFFSARYVAYRVAQHEIPGSQILKRAADGFWGRWLIPVSLGELFAVWKAA
jgi:SAM-dependent methyltransferase